MIRISIEKQNDSIYAQLKRKCSDTVQTIIRLLQKEKHSKGKYIINLPLIYLNVIVGNDNARPWITK